MPSVSHVGNSMRVCLGQQCLYCEKANSDFVVAWKLNITLYIIGYNINVLQQTACLVVNPITVDNFAFLFNCMPVGPTSDSKTVSLKDIY